MTDSPEATVRQFLGVWADPDREELASFLSDDAVWVDGPQGVRRGASAILDELGKQLAVSRGVAPEIATLVANGGTVMAVFAVEDGRITEMRETYDLQSILDQMNSAGPDTS